MSSFEHDVRALLDEANDQLLGKPTREWTPEINRRMAELCAKLGFRSTATGIADGFEWAYDFVSGKWSESGLWSGGGVKDVFLVMEIEWNTSEKDIMYDFQKLLMARAEYRMILFERSNSESLNEMKNKMLDSIDGFERKQTGDKWILSGWDMGKERFDLFHAHIVA